MKITPIASSSSGNCHIVESGNRKLILDCGISLKKIRHSLNYDFSKIDGCLISHQHADHCKASRDLSRTGMTIFATQKTISQNGLLNAVCLAPEMMFRVSDVFSFYAVTLHHDCDCYGFLVYSHAEQSNLMYITDTGRLPGRVPGLRQLIIESNHSMEELVNSGLDPRAVKRIAATHLSIDQAVEYVRKHPELEEIILAHLSDGHSDEREFKRRVQAICGCHVMVAEK